MNTTQQALGWKLGVGQQWTCRGGSVATIRAINEDTPIWKFIGTIDGSHAGHEWDASGNFTCTEHRFDLMARILPLPTRGRAYIAGPMTGYLDLNFPAFHAHAANLRAAGYEVVNPAELNPDPATPYAECMRRDLAALLTCDEIHLLAGWHRSKGACAEFAAATIAGLRIVTALIETRDGLACELERQRLAAILEASEAAGFITRVERRPLQPSAMENRVMHIDVSPRRTRG